MGSSWGGLRVLGRSLGVPRESLGMSGGVLGMTGVPRRGFWAAWGSLVGAGASLVVLDVLGNSNVRLSWDVNFPFV